MIMKCDIAAFINCYCRLNILLRMSSLTDTTVVNTYFGHFDIFILMESALHCASIDAINFVVF